MTTISLQSNHSSDCITVNAHILSKLTSTLPAVQYEPREWPHLASLQLADPDFCTPQPVDIIAGADVYGLIVMPEIKRRSPSEPIAQSTIFGWIVLGPTGKHKLTGQHSYHTAVEPTIQELQELLTKFWVQEEVQPSSHHQLSPEEQACENIFKTTHSRDEDGRYIVRIPLKSSPSVLGSSYIPAQRCLQRILRKLSTGDSYSKLYSSFMREYEELGHMKRAPPQHQPTHHSERLGSGNWEASMTLAHDASASGGLRVVADQLPERVHTHPPYYLPHHGVLREDKATTKLRVVFNGSSLTSSGISLNDIQHVGGKIQRDISDILLWIRQHRYIFSTDITKMYRQIKVHQDDWDLQRILWTDDHLNTVPYQLTTVTYGTRSAPFLAIRSLLQLVEDDGHLFPLAIEPMINGRYVDDIFGGSDNIQLLIDTSDQVSQLCMAGGFPLAKWHSNCEEFMQRISPEPIIESHSFEEDSTKLLGLSWIPRQDVFKFYSSLSSSSSKVTKRTILSETAQLYDPLGFLAPVIIRAKSLLQELWLEKTHWDAPAPERIKDKWYTIHQDLAHVSEIAIPRWTQQTQSSSVELHGFSDASQIAMAAAVYIKVTNPGQKPRVTLVCAKSKVAPLKRMSIPRLELTAAVILAKLMKYTKSVLKLTSVPTFLWTDSSVSLTWIQSHPSRWKDFVRNRVSQIQELTPNSVWRFVPGKSNPADCASRGISISQLLKHQLWWTGPPWLLKDEPSWPDQPLKHDSHTQLEERPGLSLVVASRQHEYTWEIIYRYSSLTKLLRTTAICSRAIQLFKRRSRPTLAQPLSPQDLTQARVFWTQATQAAYFAEEIMLITSAQLPTHHPFNRLTAFIDTQGTLRVGGRLSNSSLELEAIHPAILPRHSKFTDLIIADAHQRTLHGGTQLTLSYIRQSYWIIGGRAPVRSYILRCVKCARQRGIRAEQLMGQLPSSRVTPSRPFSFAGVDYAGPLTIKTWKGRGAKKQKGWLCIFVCFVTSAVHLEAVCDYSADSFIAAFRRFTGRRGICHTLHSDCGTNFAGADATLKRLFTAGTQESDNVLGSLANDGTTWKFNPPAAPHMGGKWEAAVKSVKHHLSRTIGETALTFEELTTLLIQIEAVLNSRPLEPLSEDPDDVSALTPAHFLIGESISTVPEPSLVDINQGRLTRWQLVQQRLQYFWSKWSSQYLQRQLSTSKWHHPANNITVGSLVLITDERLPPTKWPLARVTQLHPGKDRLTRVVSLKTATTTLVRPIRKLAILPSPHQWSMTS